MKAGQKLLDLWLCMSTADCLLLFESKLLLASSATLSKKLERNVSEFSKPFKMVLKSSPAGEEFVISQL